MKFNLFLILACLVSFMSCHKDIEIEESITTTTIIPEIIQLTQGDVNGAVYDKNGNPVENALIECNGNKVTTNRFGVFSFNDIKLDKQGSIIKVSKNGYVNGSDIIYPDKGTSNSRIKLLPLENKLFSSTLGGEIKITGGGTIFFAPNSIAFESSGNLYNGEVIATAHFLSPTDNDVYDAMPAGLEGIDKQNQKVVLGTAGMIAVELTNQAGQKLNIATGKKAIISIPALSKSKPSNIPLWYFNEKIGKWVEEGSAILQNESYNFEVSHFSFWNCDAPFPLINLCGKLLTEDKKPLSSVKITIEAEDLGVSSSYTDSDGTFCGHVPKNKKLKIFFNNEKCFNATYEVGPFNSNVQLDDIISNLDLKRTTVSVFCDNQSVSDATIFLLKGGMVYPLGNFNSTKKELNLSAFLCKEESKATLIAYSKSLNKESEEIQISNDLPDNISIDICKSSCAFTGKLLFDCNYEKLKIDVTGGSGNFTYKWASNLTLENISEVKIPNIAVGVSYCVEVTDNETNCKEKFCTYSNFRLSISFPSGCTKEIIPIVNNGYPPYQYSWSNGSNLPTLSQPIIGTYNLTVTDSQGCTAKASLDYTGLLDVEDNPVACSKDVFSLKTIGMTHASINGQKYTNLNALSIFDTGLAFRINAIGTKCEIIKNISLPQVKELVVKNNSPSCNTCKDGSLDIQVSADCIGCKVGKTIILASDKKTDVTSQNNNKKLPKGTYYVVVEDASTSCYVGLKKIEL